jgi:hypothetical protein
MERLRRAGPAGALAIALSIALRAAPAAGTEVWREGDLSLSIGSHVRELADWTHRTDLDAFRRGVIRSIPPPSQVTLESLGCIRAAGFANCPAWSTAERAVGESLTRVRLEVDATITRALSAHVAYDNELMGDVPSIESSAMGPETFLGLEHEITSVSAGQDYRWRWRHIVYRGYLQYAEGPIEAIVGRQRIAWGVTRLWNPIDRFNAVPPLSLEPDQSPGVDALDVRWRFGPFGFLEAVYAPGHRFADTRYAMRIHGMVAETDVSVMGGVFEEARTVGLDLERNLEEAAVHLEAVYTFPQRNVWPVGAPGPEQLDPFAQVAVGIDRRFDVGNGLYVLVEHLYNGNALGFGHGLAGTRLAFFEATNRRPAGVPAVVPGPFVRQASIAVLGGSRVVTLAEQTTGLELRYDLTAAIRGDLLTLYDWNGGSVAFYPVLTYTGWNDIEIAIGSQAFVGPQRSQFGDSFNIVFGRFDIFF